MSAPEQPREAPIPEAKIYALCTPGARKPTVRNVRYVGSTRFSLDRRLREHWRRPARVVQGWFDTLDRPPAIFLLDDLDGENAYVVIAREYELIAEWRSRGAHLLNTSKRPAWTERGLSLDPPTRWSDRRVKGSSRRS